MNIVMKQIDNIIRRHLKKSPEIVRDVASVMSKEVKRGETRISCIDVVGVGKYYFILTISADTGKISFKYSLNPPEIEPNVTFVMNKDTFMDIASGKIAVLQAMGWGLVAVKGRDGAVDRMYHSTLLAKLFNEMQNEGIIGGN